MLIQVWLYFREKNNIFYIDRTQVMWPLPGRICQRRKHGQNNLLAYVCATWVECDRGLNFARVAPARANVAPTYCPHEHMKKYIGPGRSWCDHSQVELLT